MTKMTLTTPHYVVDVVVTAKYEPYRPSKMGFDPDDSYPAEGGYWYDHTIQIGRVTDENNQQVVLDRVQKTHITRWMLDNCTSAMDEALYNDAYLTRME